MLQTIVPIAFPKRTPLPEGARFVAADAGGTKTHLALLQVSGGGWQMVREHRYPSKAFGTFSEIIRQFMGADPMPLRLSIAFAGPVQDGFVQATNLIWTIDSRLLEQELGIQEVFLLNDLEAGAYGLGMLQPADMRVIFGGQAARRGNGGVIAPGTGLGEAGLFWDGEKMHPFAGEGGHTDFAPKSALDWELQQYLQQQFGRVSWERVLSGPGMVNIFHFLKDVKKRDAPEWLLHRMEDADPAAAIGEGTRQNLPICLETHRLFVKYLAIEASDLALKLNATGGIFIGGGIPPKIWTDALTDVFNEHFFEVGRLRTLMERIPVTLVLNPKAVLLGAVGYAQAV